MSLGQKSINAGFTNKIKHFSFLTSNCSKGFTLAEVLITLVVLGIIAAITIPTMKNSLDEQRYRIPLKKTYAILSEAFDLVFSEYGRINNDAEYNNFPLYARKIINRLSVLRVCCASGSTYGKNIADDSCFGSGTLYNQCFNQPVFTDGTHSMPYFTDNYTHPNRASFILKDGTQVSMISVSDVSSVPNFSSTFGINTDEERSNRKFLHYGGNSHSIAYVVFINLNRTSSNTAGREVHAFVYTASDGLIPAGADGGALNRGGTLNKETGQYDNDGLWGYTYNAVTG